jgi:hypothetical protein
MEDTELRRLMELTGATEEACRSLLEAADYNIDTAINLFLDGSAGRSLPAPNKR